jgi:alkylhydroperoxidase family enzyme
MPHPQPPPLPRARSLPGIPETCPSGEDMLLLLPVTSGHCSSRCRGRVRRTSRARGDGDRPEAARPGAAWRPASDTVPAAAPQAPP